MSNKAIQYQYPVPAKIYSCIPVRYFQGKPVVVVTFIRLVTSIGVCYGAGYIGALYALPMIPAWFNSLNKPSFLPPNPLLIPIGMVLFLLLGLAMFFIWSSGESERDVRTCLIFFIFGLVLNVLWTYIFFGLQSPLMALMVVIMLIAIVLSTIYQSVRVSIAACLLLIPYLVACVAVAIINYLIYIMNPDLPLMVL